MTKPTKNGPKSGRELRRRSRKERLLPGGSWCFSVSCIFFPHILDVKLFLLFEVLERSNAKSSNMITVPVLDVGNQKSLFLLFFLVMPS